VDYASFWARLFAAIIDIVVLVVPSFIIIVIFESKTLLGTENQTDNPLMYFLLAGLWIIYQGGMESSKHQATAGKIILKIFVCNIRAERLSFSTAAVRCWPMYVTYLFDGLGYFVEGLFEIETVTHLTSIGIGLPAVACLHIFMSSKNQGLHDVVSGTLVLKNEKFGIPE
jgi:uncharacterized RDD family membrane protein YckC